jgi:hypothetical protein
MDSSTPPNERPRAPGGRNVSFAAGAATGRAAVATVAR